MSDDLVNITPAGPDLFTITMKRQEIQRVSDELQFKQNCAKLTAQNYKVAASNVQQIVNSNNREHAQAFLIANVIFSTEVGVLEAKLRKLEGELKKLETQAKEGK